MLLADSKFDAKTSPAERWKEVSRRKKALASSQTPISGSKRNEHFLHLIVSFRFDCARNETNENTVDSIDTIYRNQNAPSIRFDSNRIDHGPGRFDR